MELRDLRYFVAVAEDLHFGRAAARLHLAQPALSQAVKRLEQELGVELFDRSSRRVELNAVGAAFLPEARATLEHAEQALAVARRAERADLGAVSVGFHASLAASFIPRAVKSFQRDHPDVTLSLVELTLDELTEALRVAEVDIGFFFYPTVGGVEGIEDFSVEVIADAAVYVALPRAHRLARRSSVVLSELAHDDWIAISHETSRALHEDFIARCRRHGFEPTIVHEASSSQSYLGLVGEGLGAAICPWIVAGTKSDVSFVPLDDEPPARLVAAHAHSDPGIAAFIEIAMTLPDPVEDARVSA